MTIKEVEEKTGLTAKSIRFYEEKGLINIKRDDNNEYRTFTDDDIQKLKLIKILRYVDFSIEEISNILKKDDKKIISILQDKLDTLADKSDSYLEKQDFCEGFIKKIKKKNLETAINYFNKFTNFRENDEDIIKANYEFKKWLCPDIYGTILLTLIYGAPIIALFILIHMKQWDAIVPMSIFSLISTVIITLQWESYFKYRKKYKKLSKVKNRENILLFPLLFICIALVIGFFIFLDVIAFHNMAPKDYLFYENAYFPSFLMIIGTVFFIIFILGFILKIAKLPKPETMVDYIEIWDKYKVPIIVIYITIVYIFLTSVTFVTKDTIVYHSPIHPFGITYSYNDIEKIKTGFGTKNFTFANEYNRKGNFYYQIIVDNKKIIFSVPSVNGKIERYKDDTYLELEDFDNALMKLGIPKESANANAKYCTAHLDKRYCDRFERIINNK